MDDNEPFLSVWGDIAEIYREYKLYEPLNRHYGNKIENQLHISGKDRIDFIFVTKRI